MTLEYDLGIGEQNPSEEQVDTLRQELRPRNQCRKYVIDNGCKAVLIDKPTFDQYFRKKAFADGPFRDDFGSGQGEPYNPHRQVFGRLKTGEIVYVELSEEHMAKTETLFKLFKVKNKKN